MKIFGKKLEEYEKLREMHPSYFEDEPDEKIEGRPDITKLPMSEVRRNLHKYTKLDDLTDEEYDIINEAIYLEVRDMNKSLEGKGVLGVPWEPKGNRKKYNLK